MEKPSIAVIMFENNRRQHEMSAKMNDEDSMLRFTVQQNDGRRFSSPFNLDLFPNSPVRQGVEVLLPLFYDLKQFLIFIPISTFRRT